MVDQSMVDETDLFDKLHPNDHGFRKMSYQWYRALQPVLNRTGRAWPAGENPFAVTRKFLRIQSRDGSFEGRWWYRRTVAVTTSGVRRAVPVWQTLRAVPQAYRVRVPARNVERVRTVPVEGRWKRTGGRRVWVPAHTEKRTVVVKVPAHYENRVRTVRRWSSR
jgi:hypothetical protein